MRIISKKRLKDFWEAAPKQKNPKKELLKWCAVTEAAAWKTPAEVKMTFGHTVDFVESSNKSELAVFDIRNNDYRLISAIHYLAKHAEKGRVYVLRVLTHPEYDEKKWMDEL
jgi:mRNA interferase HigB